MLLSIIVPIYNMEMYLEECIESIVNQKVDDMEIILINDGSTDRSEVICDEWALKDKRIKVLHKKNEGVSSARNVGLKMATGKYVTFIDPDDFVISGTYDVLLDKIEANNADALFFAWKEIKNDNVADVKIACGQGCKGSKDAIRSILHPWFGYRGYTWNKIYKTDIVKNTEFDMRYSHAEDLLWNVQVLSEMKTIYIDDTIVNMHRILQKSLSHSNVLSPKQLSVFEVREKIIGLLNDEELRSIEKFAYHWDLSLMLKREVLCKNVQGVNLLMSCYRRDYQKDFFKNVSCKAKIENYCLMYRVRAFLKKNDVKAGKL